MVQAYQKRCPFVIDWLVDLARRSGHRLMVRLVKGAYWDSEIKRAQVDGLAGYPVYTRKVHTDVAYLACARSCWRRRTRSIPQFATHNAHTLAAIYELAGAACSRAVRVPVPARHGRAALRAGGRRRTKLDRPCRIYAPVGTHETLLAYLVRRLLENGANTSFVNRIADAAVSIDELVADPVRGRRARLPSAVGRRIRRSPLPRELFGAARRNSRGLDLAERARSCARSRHALARERATPLAAAPLLGDGDADAARRAAGAQPGRPRRRRRHGARGDADDVDARARRRRRAPRRAGRRRRRRERAALPRARRRPARGATCRRCSACSCARPARSLPNAIAEVREAVDFLRYYAAQVRARLRQRHAPRRSGPVVCISPWNFPLAIFTGQVARGARRRQPGARQAGRADAADRRARPCACCTRPACRAPRCSSCRAAARRSARRWSPTRASQGVHVHRLDRGRAADPAHARRAPRRDGRPVPLIAETGGQNAMIVDSLGAGRAGGRPTSLASAFDSAGQRCSALRVLCLQEDVADRVARRCCKGAMAELRGRRPGAARRPTSAR